jgi:serine/threonine-protein kinase Stk1
MRCGTGQSDRRGHSPMNEAREVNDDLSSRDKDLTYFAFAKPVATSPDVAHARSEEVPNVLAGRYRLERLLGAGGMGVVYRARDLLQEQFGDPEPYVALKMLSDEYSDCLDASALLFSEFALTRRVQHPNVLRLFSFEADTRHKRAFITMELMRGLTLDKLLCERPLGLPWSELQDIALPLLDALAHAHSRGVLHGDIKPSNVMLSEEGVRLFDFGLALAEEGVLPGLPKLSRRCLHAWTLGYAAPELLEGSPLTAGADVYSVACVLYELACGKHPLRRMPSNQARNAGMKIEPLIPGHLPKRCWTSLETALDFDPSQRQITVSQLRQAFTGARDSKLLQGWSRRFFNGFRQ